MKSFVNILTISGVQISPTNILSINHFRRSDDFALRNGDVYSSHITIKTPYITIKTP